jgi:glyoxylase-like metal-dependent hydrolase (beta-lactamase superfamily II)/rhodanese-related sulfurtransferase
MSLIGQNGEIETSLRESKDTPYNLDFRESDREGESTMILKQYYLGCLAHASYLIADEGTGEAVIVDPQRDIDEYLEDCQKLGLTIRYVFLTHFHADFLAGHLELRDRVGAEVCLGARSEAEFAFRAFGEGDTLSLGSVRLQTIETPGHTPEAISILVFDESKSRDEPQAVLTGDTLFIGDVGRPDLMASKGTTAAELADSLYHSLTDKLLKLPDATLVYPAHGAGSLCGRNMSSETVSTIGEQRRYNYALQPMSKEAFIELVTADQPEAPDYFAYAAELNSKERETLDHTLDSVLTPLSLEEVLELQANGAQLLDTRDSMDYSSGHMKGSLNVGLGGQYATWAGTLLSRDRPIILITEEGKEKESAVRLGRIGFDHVKGYLKGGASALIHHPELVEQLERIAAVTLAERSDQELAPIVLDVRSSRERAGKHISGSIHAPLNHLSEQLDQVPKDREVIVYCEGGYRSTMACSLLQRAGYDDVKDLVGGMKAWEASNLAVVAKT